MTGFGQAAGECAGLRVTVELRSLNNRYADVRLRLPAALAAREGEFRRRVQHKVRRGRVEVTINLEWADGQGSELTLNRAQVAALVAAAQALEDEFGVQGRLELASVLAVPGVLESPDGSPSLTDEQQAAVERTLGEALDSLDAERRREGDSLRDDLLPRLGRMGQLVEACTERAAELPAALRKKLTDRLDALARGIELDPARVAQEVAILADRADVSEELVRLRGHLQQLRALLDQPDGEPVGKRLDFLLQEVNRETNTVNSKSADLELCRHALDLKVESEKVREQIQNLE